MKPQHVSSRPREKVYTIALVCGLTFAIGVQHLAAQEVCTVSDRAPHVDRGEPAEISVWTRDRIATATIPIACDATSLTSAVLIVRLRGSFQFSGSTDDLLSRIGAISTLSHLLYWSTTEKRWLEFIQDAYALEAATPALRRGDFTSVELRAGKALYYLQQDNRSSRPVIYRMKVQASETSEIASDGENVSALTYFFVTLFPPGSMHSHIRLRRVLSDRWELSLVDWIGPEASVLALSHDASYINRAAALFRHLIGIPGDQEPPAAP